MVGGANFEEVIDHKVWVVAMLFEEGDNLAARRCIEAQHLLDLSDALCKEIVLRIARTTRRRPLARLHCCDPRAPGRGCGCKVVGDDTDRVVLRGTP